MAKKKNSDNPSITVSGNGDHKLDQIKQRAYELYEQGGCEHGRDLEHWLRAEAEVSTAVSENSSKNLKTSKK